MLQDTIYICNSMSIFPALTLFLYDADFDSRLCNDRELSDPRCSALRDGTQGNPGSLAG